MSKKLEKIVNTTAKKYGLKPLSAQPLRPKKVLAKYIALLIEMEKESQLTSKNTNN